MTSGAVSQRATVGIDLGKKERHEMRSLCLFAQKPVRTRNDLRRFDLSCDKGAQVSTRFGHQQGGPDPVAAYVSDDNAQRVIGKRKEVEVIAAGRVGRAGYSRDVESNQLRGGRGIELPLDLPCQEKLGLIGGHDSLKALLFVFQQGLDAGDSLKQRTDRRNASQDK